jgi:hypothetical protein
VPARFIAELCKKGRPAVALNSCSCFQCWSKLRPLHQVCLSFAWIASCNVPLCCRAGVGWADNQLCVLHCICTACADVLLYCSCTAGSMCCTRCWRAGSTSLAPLLIPRSP